jgi:hypothetical protein
VVRKDEREIARFRQYQRRGRELAEVNEKVCRLRPIDERGGLSQRETLVAPA